MDIDTNALPTIIDSHCHLDYLERDGQDLAEVVARAERAGVAAMVTICTKVTEFETILGIAERFPNVFCTVGIHPHEAAREPAVTADRLVELAQHPKVVGIGESGLDYYYEHSPREAQKISFIAHIEAARETGLPLVVHTRDADRDTMNILQSEHAKGAFPGLIHCFSSGVEVAERAIEINFPLSISGILTFKSAQALRDIVAKTPLDKLLVETDAPYLAPVPKRGKKNEPAYTRFTAQALAELKGVTEAELAAATTENFFTLFNKTPRAVLAAA